jgi:hypothetical protein
MTVKKLKSLFILYVLIVTPSPAKIFVIIGYVRAEIAFF